MSRLAVLLALGAFWLGAYLIGGWWGVAVMATIGFLGELLLFGVSARASRTDQRTAQRRWGRWHG